MSLAQISAAGCMLISGRPLDSQMTPEAGTKVLSSLPCPSGFTIVSSASSRKSCYKSIHAWPGGEVKTWAQVNDYCIGLDVGAKTAAFST